MVQRQHEDEQGNDSLLGRRNYMKLVGGAAVSLGALGGMSSNAAAQEYETITLDAGESRQFQVGDNETFSNKLIDMSASGANAQIVTSGTGWQIENIGFRGVCDVSSSDGFSNRIKAWGSGVIRHVYIGDGNVDGIRSGAIGMSSSHSGHVEVHEAYIAGFSDNGIYAAGRADDSHGTLYVADSYFHDNNVCSLRIASDGTVAENCVIHNTGETPTLPGGAVDGTGVYTGYGDPEQTVEVRNCHIDCRQDNNNSEAFWSHDDETTVEVYDTEWAGDALGNVRFVSGNGNSPDLTPPSSVPMDPEAAASGSAPDDGEDLSNVITISDEYLREQTNYQFSVSGDLEKSTDNDATVDDHDELDGSTVAGHVWGGTDSYRFSGEITDFSVDEVADVYLDGEQVDPSTL